LDATVVVEVARRAVVGRQAMENHPGGGAFRDCPYTKGKVAVANAGTPRRQ